jgi:hypothetical protein
VAEQHRYGSIPVPLTQLGAGGSSIAVAALHSTRASLSAEIVSLLKLLRMRAIERLHTQQWPPGAIGHDHSESHAALGRADA